jgi:hypothetical protein
MARYEYTARCLDELPAGVIEGLPRVFLERFGGSLEVVLREVAEHMPATLASLKAHYGPPSICATHLAGQGWATAFALEGEGRNVFGATRLDAFYTLSDFDNELFGALPPAMRSLYFITDALNMTELDYYSPMGWRDLPLCHYGRRELREYCGWAGYGRARAKPMIEALGSSEIEVWMFGPGRDILCVDAKRKD